MLRKVEVDQALPYVRSELSSGRDLSRLLLDQVLQNGTIVTYLPENYRSNNLKDFSESLEYLSGENFTREFELVINQIILDFLRSGSNRYAIFETLWFVDDPINEKRTVNYFSYKSKKYDFLASSTIQENNIENVLRDSKGYPMIGILTDLAENASAIVSLVELEEEMFRTLAISSQYILIGAFDGEGYLIWCKNQLLESRLP